MQPKMTTAFIAIGGNISPDDFTIIQSFERCVSTISARTNVISCSKWYQTPCFPAGAGPDYINGAIKVSWENESKDLLQFLHDIEKGLGRVRLKRWGSRTIDLDLIAHGKQILPSRDIWEHWHQLPLERQMTEAPTELVLPHPRLQDRAFVLGPLMDIAPDWVHPITGLTTTDMWQALPKTDRDQIKPI